MKYYYHESFGDLPSGSWIILLDKILTQASHLEICTSFSRAALPNAFKTAKISLPENIDRVYTATQRFRLTSAVVSEVRSREYLSWDSNDLEDPAFYQNDVLLLGTISHEDLVVIILSESERIDLNNSGFSFCKEYRF